MGKQQKKSNISELDFGLVTSQTSQSIIISPYNQKPRMEDLEPVSTLVPVFEAIRGHLAANAQGMTRDEAILEEITKLLHAKLSDEMDAIEGNPLQFYVLSGETPSQVRQRINGIYTKSISGQINGLETARELLLDESSCFFAVQALHKYRILGAQRDVVGEAYESLIFPTLRGGQGQFFTPKNVGACLSRLLNIKPNHRVIDPACGTGGFLVEASIVQKAVKNNKKPASQNLFGVDKDGLLVRLASDSLFLRQIKADIICANSLLPQKRLPKAAQEILLPESYDIVITNPPFGAKIPVTGEDVLSHYSLAHKWIFSQTEECWIEQKTLRDSVPPQILFVELCWKLLKEGGRCGIVLPEGVIGNQSTGYLRQWLLARADILAVIDCPLETFMPSTSTKTVLLVFQKCKKPKHPSVFMAIADKCGHDRRGNPLFESTGIHDDDFPRIADAWDRFCVDHGESI